MDQVGLRALLSIFTGQELADALYRAYLPQAGTKDEKITSFSICFQRRHCGPRAESSVSRPVPRQT